MRKFAAALLAKYKSVLAVCVRVRVCVLGQPIGIKGFRTDRDRETQRRRDGETGTQGRDRENLVSDRARCVRKICDAPTNTSAAASGPLLRMPGLTTRRHFRSVVGRSRREPNRNTATRRDTDCRTKFVRRPVRPDFERDSKAETCMKR